MPSISSHQEGLKYGKTYFGYSGWHQLHINFQPSSLPLSGHVATPAKVYTAVAVKIMCNVAFIFCAYKIL